MKVKVGSDNKLEVLAVPVSSEQVTSTERSGSNLTKIRVNIVDAESGEAQEEVDVYTSADAVLTDPNTGENILEYIDYRLRFTNSSPMPIGVGGFPKGTTFREMLITDVLNGLLYPTTAPVGTLTTDKSTDVPYELGVDINPIIFTVNFEQTSYDVSNIQLLKDGQAVRNFTFDPDATSATLTYNAIVDKDTEFAAKLVDVEGHSYTTESLKYRFVHPIYVGCVDSTAAINETTLKTLGRVVYDDKVESGEVYSLGKLTANNQKIIIGIKPEWTIGRILDCNMNDITSAFESNLVGVEVVANDNQQYTVYYTDANHLHTFTDKEFYLSI